jgi:hypothetical protein
MAFIRGVEWIIENKCGGNKGRFNEMIGQRQADYRWRSEAKLPSLEAVLKICHVFAVRIEWLLSSRGDPHQADETKEELKALVMQYKDLAEHYKTLLEKSNGKI